MCARARPPAQKEKLDLEQANAGLNVKLQEALEHKRQLEVALMMQGDHPHAALRPR